MKHLFIYPAFLFVLIFQISCSPTKPLPPTVSKLDKSRYAGDWHEIARLPNFFERDLVAAKATYELNADGTISVRNNGLKANGETTSITGSAKPANTQDPGKLLVRFNRFPANLFAGDYWIHDVNSDYTQALVGSPNRKFLWLLSKNPADDRKTLSSMVSKANSIGYDTEKLYFNPKRVSN